MPAHSRTNGWDPYAGLEGPLRDTCFIEAKKASIGARILTLMESVILCPDYLVTKIVRKLQAALTPLRRLPTLSPTELSRGSYRPTPSRSSNRHRRIVSTPSAMLSRVDPKLSMHQSDSPLVSISTTKIILRPASRASAFTNFSLRHRAEPPPTAFDKSVQVRFPNAKRTQSPLKKSRIAKQSRPKAKALYEGLTGWSDLGAQRSRGGVGKSARISESNSSGSIKAIYGLQ